MAYDVIAARAPRVASMGAASRGSGPGAELARIGTEIDAVRLGSEQTEQITRELLGST
jgi:hypothetical protein